MKTKPVVVSTEGVSYEIDNGKLREVGHFQRVVSLTAVGKVLRHYKATNFKSNVFNKLKTVRIFYSGTGFASPKYAYSVPVWSNGTKGLSIGCVSFLNRNAAVLRRAALRSSKVTA